jgi:hypothetical protein
MADFFPPEHYQAYFSWCSNNYGKINSISDSLKVNSPSPGCQVRPSPKDNVTPLFPGGAQNSQGTEETIVVAE